MKKSAKTLFSLLLTLVMVMSLAGSVIAVDYPAASQPAVECPIPEHGSECNATCEDSGVSFCEDYTWLTAHKVWLDECENIPESVEVQLLQDGKPVETVCLTAENYWTYTWGVLEKGYEWSVVEVVPEGYVVDYTVIGNLTVITNAKAQAPVCPDVPEIDVPACPEIPEIEIPECPEIPEPTCPEFPEPTCPEIPEPTCPDFPEPTCPEIPEPTCPDFPEPTCPEIPEPTCPDLPDPNIPDVDLTWQTVHKIWLGDVSDIPDYVEVHLLRDGKFVTKAYLSPLTYWTFTWALLEDGHEWTVVEVVPEGYEAEYYTIGNLTVITNTKIEDPIVPDETEPSTEPDVTEPDETEPDVTEPDVTEPDVTEPDVTEPDVTEPDETIPDVTVPDETVPDETVPDETVPDVTVPDETIPDVTVPEETVPGETVPSEPAEPVELTVKKVWDDDKTGAENRPGSVSVTLLDGEDAVATVQLNEANNWQYTWKDLSSDGDWSVIEVNIPEGYTPSYSVSGNVVTITNTATLIQTGQLNWPIMVFSVLGVMLVCVGCAMTFRKESDRA